MIESGLLKDSFWLDNIPANHYIDKENKIIFTIWYGEPSDSDLVDALNIYLRDIKSKSEFDGFNELVDFTDAKGLRLSIDPLIELGKIASKSDKPGNNKLATVVNSSLAYGLAKMNGVYRNYNPQSNKEVLVFKNKSEAMAWLKTTEVTKNDKDRFFLEKMK